MSNNLASQSPVTALYYSLLETVSLKLGDKKQSGGDKSSTMTPLDISKMFNIANDAPYSADIQSLRGWCLQQIHKKQLALYVYDQVLQKYPLHAVTLRRKGQLLKTMGQEEKSQQILKLACLLQPDNLHLEILKQEQDARQSDQSSQISNESSSEDEESQQKDKSQCWRIRIKSIDRPLSQTKTVKSVIFKSLLLEEGDTLSQTKIIGRRTSILKTRSHQNTSIQQLPPESQIKSAFDIGKIKSIDGKMSCNSIQVKKKQIVFTYNNQNLKPHSSNEVSLRRKSSLMLSKFGTNKQVSKENLK